ncbi:hypothetical protein DUI87_18397 [Hirundo rustica rustica]|uniref:Uncharacterized protein n=1 Tax=Hirundo rustica rustica TaxID=333673 RepID=A0A3M0JW20_HIRRU|nr:hypothetical protein DUI87_18397 [Hirundo rustica rustica]
MATELSLKDLMEEIFQIKETVNKVDGAFTEVKIEIAQMKVRQNEIKEKGRATKCPVGLGNAIKCCAYKTKDFTKITFLKGSQERECSPLSALNVDINRNVFPFS